MLSLTVNGIVASLNARVGEESGKKMVIMRIACRTDVKTEEPPYKWVPETFFVECVAWDERGEFWERNFPVGDGVVVTGRPNFRVWTNKKTGEISKTIKMYGFEGETPHVTWGRGSRDAGQQQGGERQPTNRYRRDSAGRDDDLGM